jgi:hypothetical protein
MSTVHNGWPVRPTARPVFLAVAAIVAAGVLLGFTHRPSRTELAADLRTMAATLGTDLRSCAGGLRDSLTASRAISSGASRDRATAINIAQYGSANCSPLGNGALADLISYEVPGSLARFGLTGAVRDLTSWAWVAATAQRDLAAGLTGNLASDLRKLDQLRSSADQYLTRAAHSLSLTLRLPDLPGGADFQ